METNLKTFPSRCNSTAYHKWKKDFDAEINLRIIRLKDRLIVEPLDIILVRHEIKILKEILG